MADSMMITCPAHSCPLIPSFLVPGDLACPEQDCGTVIHITIPDDAGFPPSPLTSLEQGAAAHHELVLSYEAAGFSRSEAMQIVCTVITALLMKGSGSG